MNIYVIPDPDTMHAWLLNGLTPKQTYLNPKAKLTVGLVLRYIQDRQR